MVARRTPPRPEPQAATKGQLESLRRRVRELEQLMAARSAQAEAQAEEPTSLLPARSYDPWTTEESTQLRSLFLAPWSTSSPPVTGRQALMEIARRHRRSASACASRAAKLGIIPSSYQLGGGVDEQLQIAVNVLEGKPPLDGVAQMIEERKFRRVKG